MLELWNFYIQGQGNLNNYRRHPSNWPFSHQVNDIGVQLETRGYLSYLWCGFLFP
jgi:hypothetical protein